jgi:hypothetical protein
MNQDLKKSICHKSDQQMEEEDDCSLHKHYLKKESINEIFISMLKLNLASTSEFNEIHELNRYIKSNIDASTFANLPDESVFQNAVALTFSDKEAAITSKEDRKILRKRKFKDMISDLLAKKKFKGVTSSVNLVQQANNTSVNLLEQANNTSVNMLEQANNTDTDEENDNLLNHSALYASNLIFDTAAYEEEL